MIEPFELGAARRTGHPAKPLQQRDGALIGAIRAVAEELDVFVRPSQSRRIGGAALERSSYRVGDAGSALRGNPDSQPLPRIERGFAAQGLAPLLALPVRALAHTLDE